jgi:hypothetical protein
MLGDAMAKDLGEAEHSRLNMCRATLEEDLAHFVQKIFTRCYG